IITRPVTISAPMAMILISANQNSVSPKARTVGRFNTSSTAIQTSAGIHSGRSGHQNAIYPAIATTSAIPVTTQQNQYVQPVKNPAHGPSRSPANSANDL